ncbi:MAG: lytic transglycosylase domain-containing protein [Treponema sp.]|nr:lytic transglycosylase domain-containing protein [Treponema sp.]
MNYKKIIFKMKLWQHANRKSHNRIECKLNVLQPEFREIPVFFGCLWSLFLCALLTVQLIKLPVQLLYPAVQLEITDIAHDCLAETEEEFDAMSYDEFAGENINGHFFIAVNAHLFTQSEPEYGDTILEMYRQPKTRDIVLAFFGELCQSSEIAEIILANTDVFNIPPALAFALVWEESRFNPLAVNTRNKNETVDRGLFQLNSRSFSHLELSAFFNPQLNAYHGLRYLRYCMDTGGTEIAALAMYNAGTGRVSNTGTPKSTLDYVSRILSNRSKIENIFFQMDSHFQEMLSEDVNTEPELEIELELTYEEPERSRLAALLVPLGIR